MDLRERRGAGDRKAQHTYVVLSVLSMCRACAGRQGSCKAADLFAVFEESGISLADSGIKK
ncbi:hypothetical protein DESPIG_01973 [Desulfovibrio piger ATCC 29098]|uniref:Uncharacterized protein n=1 Tax=Desulfovibrio piger ATCC 29098 TaxID=411464 RepID=B6WV57_9BACT|nr:hypothetical protein DESPIG_01973 [Desulfovibrio piger ATCC 29098]